MEGAQPDYLRGFVHGMHFLLLALDGRLRAARGNAAETERILAEYYLLVEDYRDLYEAPAATKIALRYEDDAPAGAGN